MEFKNYVQTPSVSVIKECIPQIIIKKQALAKMKILIDECDDEIGWLGTAFREKNTILIDDVFLFRQEVHSTTTEITTEGLTQFAEEILAREGGIELWNNLRLWGHSHVNMSPTPSSQDNSQMIVFKDSGHDWFLRIIANKKGEIKVDLYDYALGAEYKDLPWFEYGTKEELEIKKQIAYLTDKLQQFDNELLSQLRPALKAEMDDKVSRIYSKWTSDKMTIYGSTSWWNNKHKKKEETKEEKEEDIVIIDEDEYFTDVEKEAINKEMGMYDYWFMAEAQYCNDLDELRYLMSDYGFYLIYNDDDLREYMIAVDEAMAKVYERGKYN